MVGALEEAGGLVDCLSAANNVSLALRAEEVVRYVRRHRIDLLHCHLPWAGFVGRWVHQRTGLPVVYTEHNKQERYHGITRWLNKVTFNYQTVVVAVSADVRQSIEKNISPAIPIIEVLNGVNTHFFQREEGAGLAIRARLGIPAGAMVVGTVAVFRFQKRLKEWLRVFGEATRSGHWLYGIVVGDGPLRAEVEAEVQALGLEGRVFLAGLQTDVKPWYAAMDIFMMTSVFEGLPIALLEAMSMGCAVVTTDAGGIKEVVRHEREGLVVSVDAWPSMAALLGQVADDEALRQRLAQAARARVEDSFGLVRMVRELEDIYESLVER